MQTAAAALSPRYISCADTAKLVRAALKQAFPGQKFSVRSSVYSMGASINVSWAAGPDQDAVDAVARAFRGADFDGSVDLKTYRDSELSGERVRYGADFIFCNRECAA